MLAMLLPRSQLFCVLVLLLGLDSELRKTRTLLICFFIVSLSLFLLHLNDDHMSIMQNGPKQEAALERGRNLPRRGVLA